MRARPNRGRQRPHAQPAEGSRHPPAVIRLLESLVTRERVLHRLLVVAEAVSAHAGAALRVARPGLVTGSREELAGLEVKANRLRVVTLRIRQQPELAD